MNTEALGMDMDILEKLKNGSAGPSMRFFNLKYDEIELVVSYIFPVMLLVELRRILL